ncbi:MAG: hypothetical protein M3041_07885 [Acidobacteriota bacterium]|nr:hypothetical protein [Acidobacteriota bacterium]
MSSRLIFVTRIRMGWYQKIVGEQNVLRDRSYTRWNELNEDALNEDALVEEKKREAIRIDREKAQQAKPKTASQ